MTISTYQSSEITQYQSTTLTPYVSTTIDPYVSTTITAYKSTGVNPYLSSTTVTEYQATAVQPYTALTLNTDQATLIKLYIAAFLRAPDKGGFEYWSSQLSSGKSYADVCDTIFSLGVVKEIYPDSLTNNQFITKIYENIFDKQPDAGGLAYWAGRLNSGEHKGKTVTDMILAGLSTPDGTTGKNAIVNSVALAEYQVFQQEKLGVALAPDSLKTSMATITSTNASLVAAILASDTLAVTSLSSQTLTAPTRISETPTLDFYLGTWHTFVPGAVDPNTGNAKAGAAGSALTVNADGSYAWGSISGHWTASSDGHAGWPITLVGAIGGKDWLVGLDTTNDGGTIFVWDHYTWYDGIR